MRREKPRDTIHREGVGTHDGHAPIERSRRMRWSSGEIAELFFAYLARGDMRVHDLITHRHDPRNAKAVYDGLSADRSGALGALFDWTRV